MTGAHLVVESASVAFGATDVLRDFSIDVGAGEIVALLGPSGSGKSTLLRAVAGLDPLTSGRIEVDGHDVSHAAPDKRGVGFMMQTPALFPSRNVAQNVGFGLEMQGRTDSQINRRVQDLLELVGLAGFGDRQVANLSGGEAQRVALARALAPAPGLVMLDEPMGSLDRLLRERLAQDIRTILLASGVSALLVTHDLDEAFTMADRVAVMNDGRLNQIGKPTELTTQPTDRFVARFVGLSEPVDTNVGPDGSIQVGPFLVERRDWPEGPCSVLLPPKAVAVLATAEGNPNAVVLGRRYEGSGYVYGLRVGDFEMHGSSEDLFVEGDRVGVVVDHTQLVRLEK